MPIAHVQAEMGLWHGEFELLLMEIRRWSGMQPVLVGRGGNRRDQQCDVGQVVIGMVEA